MNEQMIRDAARLIAENEELLNIGRCAVQQALIEYRDSRISRLDRRNGLCIRERNGEDSGVIRLGTDDALRIALLAIAEGFDAHHFQRIADSYDAKWNEKGPIAAGCSASTGVTRS